MTNSNEIPTHTPSIDTKAIIPFLLFSAILISVLLAGCTSQEKTVSYKQDIVPILKARCYECHLPSGEGYKASGLDMDSYATLMKGTKFGPVIIPGNSLSSTLVILIDGRADNSINMPHNRAPLKEENISLIKQWIDQGARNN